MEASRLKSDGFWESAESIVLENPRDSEACAEAGVIREWVANQSEFSAYLLFRTSGSTGKGKWVVLSKAALLASARAVNEFFAVTSRDRWLQTLPLFHVGGVGILARAYLADCDVVNMEGKWDAERCHQLVIDYEVSFVSLVPAQLADFVRLKLRAPASLRVVLIGGGQLSDALYQQAVDLGWLISETYGMTETSSQIATAKVGSRELRILPCWQVKKSAEGRLQVMGSPLLQAYLGVDKQCFLEDPKEEGWLITSDLGEVNGDVLRVRGRVDRCVKILGELINLGDIENQIADRLKEFDCPETAFALVTRKDDRSSHKLVLVSENPFADEILESYHQKCHPLHRIEEMLCIDVLPRTGIGKIDYVQLVELL